jgi:hypothetical protein
MALIVRTDFTKSAPFPSSAKISEWNLLSPLNFQNLKLQYFQKNPFSNCFPTKFLAKITFAGRKYID